MPVPSTATRVTTSATTTSTIHKSSGRGAALIDRLAAQADAAFASADHPLKAFARETDKEKLDEAVELLLKRPTPDEFDKGEPPVDLVALRKAAELGDIKALAALDKRLRLGLDGIDHKQLLEEGDLTDPAAKEALKLYQDSYMKLETGGRHYTKEAFQAVMKDDVEALTSLLDLGVSPNATNSGGHTLLQLAKERGKINCATTLLTAGANDL
mmetsp:Transcript_28641/g.62318  ORF Transcript_28641/g.62318 Transcript_28641/m.62318 type:complete len:213 (-) Transcript_28641:34-672(-)